MNVLSVQLGMPQAFGNGVSSNPMFGRWTTGIFKSPFSGPVWLDKLNLKGDAQADLSVHGGPDKAVYAYPSIHYPDWRNELGFDDFPFGAFGENLTVEGADESQICIGDVHQIGNATIEVAQPRQPCWKLARKWTRPDLPARLVKSGRSGWYYRVLNEGHLQAGDEIVLLRRPFPQWTVRRANELLYKASLHREEALALAECEALAVEWRNGIHYRLGLRAET
jgi:MOSC domain-containing protein YiiM